MQVIGYGLSRILVERKEKFDGKLEVKSNINIDEVSRERVPISKEDVLKVKFTFSLDYSKDFAKVEFKGYILLLPEQDELKKFLKEWKTKKIPENVRIPLFNLIMNKCNIKALQLEEEMGLPFHIQMPRIKQKTE